MNIILTSAALAAGLVSLFVSATALAQSPAAGKPDATEIAKKVQNPIGDLYSVPIQGDFNFGYGPRHGTQVNVNLQPVIPIHLNEDWNLITRTVLPLVWQPSLYPGHSVPFGTGPTTFSMFLSPAQPTNGWLWGVGPAVQVPTASDSTLGSSVWGGGPTAVLIYMKGPWVAGALANNVWSFGGTPGLNGNNYSSILVQPFVNYNFGGGWYVNSSPLITASWPAVENKAWTVPVGAGFGKIVFIGGKLPVNFSIGAYYNAVRTEFGATWQAKTQVTVIF